MADKPVGEPIKPSQIPTEQEDNDLKTMLAGGTPDDTTDGGADTSSGGNNEDTLGGGGGDSVASGTGNDSLAPAGGGTPAQPAASAPQSGSPQKPPEGGAAASLKDTSQVDNAVAIAKAVADALKPPPAKADAPKTPSFEDFVVTPEDIAPVYQDEKAGAEYFTKFGQSVIKKAVELIAPVIAQAIQPTYDYIAKQTVEKAKSDFATKYPQHKEWLEEANSIAASLMKQKEYEDWESLFVDVDKALSAYKTKYEGRFKPSTPTPPPAAAPANPGSPAARPASKCGKKLSEDEELMQRMDGRLPSDE